MLLTVKTQFKLALITAAAITLAVAPVVSAQSSGGLFQSLFKKRPTVDATNPTPANPALEALSSEQVATAMREALGAGVQRAIAELGRTNGFLTNATARIPVPKRLQRIERGLRKFGQEKIADEFILTMNRAAEQAVPAAAQIFGDVVKKMSIEDAKSILQGADDAATTYFREATEKELQARFRPIVEEATANTGVTAAYKALMGNSGLGRRLLSFRGGGDLDQHVTDQALESLFKRIAAQEQKIRQTPAARTTKTLQKVFGILQGK